MRAIRPGFFITAALLAALFVSACSNPSSSVTATGCVPADGIVPSNLKLVFPGRLTIASDLTNPPMEYVDPTTHAYVGLDVDIANEFAKRLCLIPYVQNVPLNMILTSVAESAPGIQDVDMALSSLPMTHSSKQQVDMIPYFTAGESLLVPASNPKNIKSKNDLCGLSVAVEAGTNEETEIADIPGATIAPALNQTGGACAKNPIKLQSFPTEDQVIQALQDGSVDATYQDSSISGYYTKLDSGTFVEITMESPAPEGIAVRNDNAPFEAAIKQILSDMESDGTYTTILAKWGLTDGACTLTSACASEGAAA